MESGELSQHQAETTYQYTAHAWVPRSDNYVEHPEWCKMLLSGHVPEIHNKNMTNTKKFTSGEMHSVKYGIWINPYPF